MCMYNAKQQTNAEIFQDRQNYPMRNFHPGDRTACWPVTLIMSVAGWDAEPVVPAGWIDGDDLLLPPGKLGPGDGSRPLRVQAPGVSPLRLTVKYAGLSQIKSPNKKEKEAVPNIGAVFWFN